MKYEAPDMEVVAVNVDTAIAAEGDHEISIGAGSLLSKNP